MGKICGIVILALLILAQGAFGVPSVSTSTITSGQVWTVPQWNTGLNYAENWINSNLLNSGNTFTIAGGESLDVQGTAKFDTSRFTGFIDLATHITPRATRLYRIGLPTRLLWALHADTVRAAIADFDTVAGTTIFGSTPVLRPASDLAGQVGLPTFRFNSVTADTGRFQVVATDTLTGTTIADTWNLVPKTDQTGTIGRPTKRVQAGHYDTLNANGTIDSTDIENATVSGADLRADAVDSTTIRAASVAGSDLAGTLSGAKTWTGAQTLNTVTTANDSVTVTITTDGTAGTSIIRSGLVITRNATNQLLAPGGGAVLFRNRQYSGNISDAARIAVTNTADVSNAAKPALVFYTGDAGAISERLRVTDAGLVLVNKTAADGSERFSVTVADNGVASVFKVNAAQGDVTAADVFAEFRSTSGVEGSIAGTASAGVLAYNTFTGAHYAQMQDENEVVERGMIVSATGNVMQETTEYLPLIRKSNGRTDKAVYGVFAGRIARGCTRGFIDSIKVQRDSLSEGRIPKWKLNAKGTSADFAQGDPTKDTYQVLSLGTGIILVTDTGGNIEVGDLISPSVRAGYGERQSIGNFGIEAEDIVRSKTVAKVSVAVDWATVSVDLKAGFKRKLIPCVYK